MMKRTNTLISLVLACIMIAMNMSAVFAANDISAETTSDNSADSVFIKDLEFLKAIGVADEKGFSQDKEITRGEFAVAVSRILSDQSKNATDNVKSIFSDMENQPPETIAAVNLLATYNIIAGVGNGQFMPDSSITYGQALKILVGIAGYDMNAQSEGGFIQGYVSVASRLGITNGTEVKADKILVAADAVKLLYNTLFTEVMQIESVGIQTRYKTVRDETVLTNIMQIKIVKNATVSANSSTSANGGSGIGSGNVKVNDEIYLVGNSNADKYIGRTVNIYYKGEDTKVIVYVELRKSDDNAPKISFDDIEELDGYTIKYYESDGKRTKTYRLSKDAVMIVNDKYYAYTPELINTELNGTITIARDNSGMDIVTVRQYEDFLIDAIDYNLFIMYDKINRGSYLDLSDTVDSEDCIITYDGQALKFSDLEKGDLLAVYKSPEGDSIKIEASNNKITASVGSISKDELQIEIEGDTYKVRPAVKIENLTMGREYEMYINLSGKIAYIENNINPNNDYAYFVRAYMDENGEDTYLKMYTSSGKMETVKVSNNLKINDVSAKGNVMATIQNQFMINGTYTGTLIRYKKNSYGELTQIYTPQTKIADNNGINRFISKRSITYKSTGSFGLYFSTDNNTLVFAVPSDGSSDEERYSIGNPWDYFSKDLNYTVEAYNVDDVGIASVIVYYDSAETYSKVGSNNLDLLLVDRVNTAVNDDDEVVEEVEGLCNGKYVSYMTDGEVSLTINDKKLKRGDLIRFVTNRKEEISAVELCVDSDNFESSNTSFGTKLSAAWGFSGVVYSVDDIGYARLSKINSEDMSLIDFNDIDNMYAVKLAGNIMVYDSQNNSIYTGLISDIMPYISAGGGASRFFATYRWEAMQNIIIFK